MTSKFPQDNGRCQRARYHILWCGPLARYSSYIIESERASSRCVRWVGDDVPPTVCPWCVASTGRVLLVSTSFTTLS